MQTRRTFLWTVGTGLWTLAGGTGWAQTALPVPSPVDVVTQYVAARAAQDYAKAYALLSADVQKNIPYSQFAEVKDVQRAYATALSEGTPPVIVALGLFFMDTHNTLNYTFTVVGPDPADPHTVLVNAQPPVKSTAAKPSAAPPPLLLRVVTAPNSAGVPRVELLETYQKTVPHEADKMREQARLTASLSNLKKIGLAFITYNDAEKHLPDAAHWTEAIQQYTGGTEVLIDQSAPKGQQYSYAFNRALSGVNLDSLANPSDTVLAFTSTLGTKNAADTGQSLPDPGWHTGGSVVVFCNGLARWVKDGTPLRFTP